MPLTPMKLNLQDGVKQQGHTLNMAIPTGADYSQTFRLRKITGRPEDITGWTFAAKIKDEAGNIVATFTAAVVSGPAGTFSITMPAATTSGLTASVGIHDWDIFRTNAGDSTLIMFGKCQIKEGKSV